MKQYIIISLSAVLSVLAARGADVVCTAGALSSLIDNPAAVTELRLSGSVDASDLFFIDDEMSALRSLDLSAVSISAYKGDPMRGISQYAANTIPTGAFGGSKITTVSLPAQGSVTIGDLAFASSALTSISVPASVTAIGQGAFSGCASLSSAILSDATLGGYVFKDCTALESVALGSTTVIGEADFAGCTSLMQVYGSENLTAIGASAFKGCTILQNFNFGSPLKTIGESAFASTGLHEADLSVCDNLTAIGSWAFSADAALVSVTIPDTVEAMGQGVFFDCTSLTSLSVPTAIDEVPAYTLKDAAKLSTVAIPDDVTRIGAYALKGASSMSAVTLPASLEYIGDNAMEGASAVTRIDASKLDAVPELGNDVWSGLDQNNIRLDVKDDLANEFLAADQWQDFNIKAINTGAIAPDVAVETSLRGRFFGTELRIEAIGTAITRVELYDPSGLQLVTVDANAETVSVDTSHLSGALYIVRCILADGTLASLKLARR